MCINKCIKGFDQIPYEDKEDLASEIIQKNLRLRIDFELLRKFRGDSKFSSYLYQIVTLNSYFFKK